MSLVSISNALTISIASQCERGTIREENQDTARHTSTRLGDLLVVAEAVDACPGASLATSMAVDTVSSSIEGMPAFFPQVIAVEEAICRANAAIAAAIAQFDSPDSRIGATVVVALLHAETDYLHTSIQAIIGHVGNSRAYLVRNQKIELITGDRTVERDLSDHQIVSQVAEIPPEKKLPTQYLGMELNVQVQMRQIPLDAGDTLLLCSEGLWGYVPEQQILRILADGTRSVEEASRALLDLALDAGGLDNVAIEIARLTQDGNAATAACSVEAEREVLPEIDSFGEFEPASDTSQPDWPNVRVTSEKVNSVTELLSPMRKKMFGIVRGLGKRNSDKYTMAEKPIVAQPTALAVSGVQPTVSWVTPEPISYGTELSSIQLNACASVPGKFRYTPGTGYLLPAGMHTLWAAFSATDSPEDDPMLAEVAIAVSKATPSIQWPTPANVAAGVALDATQLNASASVPGTFQYSPVAGEVLSPGMHTLSVTFNPLDNANYTTAQATLSITVAKSVPKIDWTPPEPIVYGTPLGVTQLNALASVAGKFEYSPVAGEVLSAGSHTLSVTFIPSDGTSYEIAQTTIQLTVMRSTPVIVWPTPERIVYGTALNDVQLNATASSPGTFRYNPGCGAILAAGAHTPSVIFTPSNLSDYTPVEAAVPLNVLKAAPIINWPVPDPINSATPLGATQLNASASVPGNFAYSPAAGELLGAGVHPLSVTFTPTDSANYTPVQAIVSLAVTEITPAEIVWPNPSPISYGTALSDEQFNACSLVPGSFFYTPAVGDVLPPGEHTLSAVFTPEDQEKHAKVKAIVTLIVERLPHVAILIRTCLQTPSSSSFAAQPAAPRAAARGAVNTDDQPAKERETRTYRGAIYEKGDDGQWHLQQR